MRLRIETQKKHSNGQIHVGQDIRPDLKLTLNHKPFNNCPQITAIYLCLIQTLFHTSSIPSQKFKNKLLPFNQHIKEKFIRLIVVVGDVLCGQGFDLFVF